MDNGHKEIGGTRDRAGSEINETSSVFDGVADRSSSGVDDEIEQSQSLINEAKEMARRDWDSAYEGSQDATTVPEAGASVGNDDALLGGSFSDAQSDVDSEMTGPVTGSGATLGGVQGDTDTKVDNMQAGLGGSIGTVRNDLGSTFGDDQIDAGGPFNDLRGGAGSGTGLVAGDHDHLDTGSEIGDNVGLDRQSSQPASSADDPLASAAPHSGDSFDNVQSTLAGGFGDEQEEGGSKFDSVRAEVDRAFSGVSNEDQGGIHDVETEVNQTLSDAHADVGEMRFSDTGIADESSGSAHGNEAGHTGNRSQGGGFDLRQRAGEAREQAAQRLEDARHHLLGGDGHAETDGKSVVKDVQEKAKGLLNKAKDVFDRNK